MKLPQSVLRSYHKQWPEKFMAITVEDKTEDTFVEIDRVYTCYDCMDTLEVPDYYYDADAHIFMPNGSKPCVCTL